MPRKTNRVTLSTMSWDATPERLLKAANDNVVVQDTEENGAPVSRRVVRDWPLARLHSRGLLGDTPDENRVLFEAGERYFADFYSAGLAPLGAIDYGREHVDGGSLGGLNVSEYRLAALQRYRTASAAMGEHRAIVDAVVLRGMTATEAANDNGAPERTARRHNSAALREGLRRLAARYGIDEKRSAA